MTNRRLLAGSVLAVALGIVPAAADSPRAMGLTSAQFALGSTTVAFVCWPGIEAGNVPRLQLRRSTGWETVARGQLDVPQGWQAGLCPDPAFSVPVYYPWLVQDSGTPTGQAGHNSARVREFLPARTSTHRASYTLQVMTQTCKNPADGYRIRVTKTKKVPGSELPANGSRFVRRCNGPVASSRHLPLKVRLTWQQHDRAVRGPGVNVVIRVSGA